MEALLKDKAPLKQMEDAQGVSRIYVQETGLFTKILPILFAWIGSSQG